MQALIRSSFGFVLLTGSVCTSLFADEASQSVVHRSPGNIEYEITADGLSAIRCGDRQLAFGNWSPFNAGN